MLAVHLGALCTYTPFKNTLNTTAWTQILPGGLEEMFVCMHLLMLVTPLALS